MSNQGHDQQATKILPAMNWKKILLSELDVGMIVFRVSNEI